MLSAGKFAKESIDRRHVKRRNERFQLGEQDFDQTGNGLLELCSLSLTLSNLYLVSDFSSSLWYAVSV